MPNIKQSQALLFADSLHDRRSPSTQWRRQVEDTHPDFATAAVGSQIQHSSPDLMIALMMCGHRKHLSRTLCNLLAISKTHQIIERVEENVELLGSARSEEFTLYDSPIPKASSFHKLGALFGRQRKKKQKNIVYTFPYFSKYRSFEFHAETKHKHRSKHSEDRLSHLALRHFRYLRQNFGILQLIIQCENYQNHVDCCSTVYLRN